MRISLYFSLIFCLSFTVNSQVVNSVENKKPYVCTVKNEKLLFSDNFTKKSTNWLSDLEDPAGSSVNIIDGKLDINVSAGATIWFKNKLSGNIMILYDVVFIDAGGKNDRVSDMNAFWMASAPGLNGLPQKDGRFSSYDSLNLYYAGVGGHYNKFTRFRKYHRDGNKPVLKEYSDASHLLAGKTEYSIKIVVQNGLIRYFVNDELFWDFTDEKPYQSGYFGFRTTQSHQQIDNFMVFNIE